MAMPRSDSIQAAISRGCYPGRAGLRWPCRRGCVLVRCRCGMARLGCTAAAACGYGTGVGQAATAGDVHGFPAALTSFIGRARPAREVADLMERHRRGE
jgi:hypothetical protein